MTEWQFPNALDVARPRRIIEISEALDDPVLTYMARYGQDQSEPSVKDYRYKEEIFSDLNTDSTILLLGSGHSSHANFVLKECASISKVAVLDYIDKAGEGLEQEIEFYGHNILLVDIPETYDYIFSSHTIEHFTREQILDVILPKCIKHAREAVFFVIPYGDNWGDEPSHRCRFYEDDELAAQALKYKKIYNDHELALWFEGKANK